MTAAGADLFVWSINGHPIAHRCISSASSSAAAPTPLKAYSASAAAAAAAALNGDAILSVAVAKEPGAVIITGHQDGSLRFFSVEYASSSSSSATLVPRHHVPGAHRAPVTCLHTSAHDLARLWSGDACGDVSQVPCGGQTNHLYVS